MDLFDFTGQAARRNAIVEATMKKFGYLETDEAAFTAFWKNAGLRDALFLASGLLCHGDGHVAFIEKVLDSFPAQYWKGFCTFTPFMSLSLLIRFEDVLTKGIIEKFKNRALNAMPFNCLQTYDFIGVNDNTPAMIMAHLFLAGEYFNNPEWTKIADARLTQFEQMVTGQSFISEFNSPTYHAVTTLALAVLANLVKDESVRARALACEDALWKMAFAFYHRGTCQAAGPYARAYRVDSTAHTHQYRMMYYQVLGDKMAIHPLNTLYADDEVDVLLHGKDWFMMFSNCWLAWPDYHCPAAYIQEALERPYPVQVKGNAHVSASADTHMLPGNTEENLLSAENMALFDQEDLFEYAPGVTEIQTYITDSYALGACTKEFHNGGQTDSFHVLLTEKTPADKQEQITAMYTRFIVNNEKMDAHNIHEQGRKLAYAKENTAIVLYAAKAETQEITSLKQCLLIANGFRSVQEIRCGGRSLSEGDRVTAAPVFLRFAQAYCMVYPLTGNAPAELLIERMPDAGELSLSFILFESETPVHFARKRLKLCAAGFAFEIRDAQEAGSFDGFIASMSGARVDDLLYANLHTRFAVERRTSYSCGGTSLEVCYAPVTEGIRYILEDGRIVL